MFYIPGTGYVGNGEAFTVGADLQAVRYPAGWFAGKTPDELAAIGAVPVVYGARPDDRYYFVSEIRDGASITYASSLRPDVLQIRLAELAAHRYAVETAGIDLGGGAVLASDRGSQAMVHGAYNSLKEGFVASVDFKAGASGWAALNFAQIAPMAAALAVHVQACFTNEKAHGLAMAALAAAEDWPALVAYDFTTGWPPVAAQGGN